MNTKKPCLGAIVALALLAAPFAQAQDATATGDRDAETRAGQTSPAATVPSTSAPRPFDELDTNADGAISKDEAAVDPPLAQVFGTLDKDADGRLTPEEYEAYAQGTP